MTRFLRLSKSWLSIDSIESVNGKYSTRDQVVVEVTFRSGAAEMYSDRDAQKILQVLEVYDWATSDSPL